MTIAVLDPGIGNLSSVCGGVRRAGGDTVVVSDATSWQQLVGGGTAVSGVILPGVGAFGDAMFQLRRTGLIGVIRQVVREGRPLLGICLGMQLLFSMSEEHGTHMGLGLLPGRIVRFGNQAKVPHMGWNDLTFVADHPLLAGVQKGDYVYFVHSYYAQVQEPAHLLAATQYAGVEVPAVVGRGTLVGTQFHPEKSGSVGERILANFVAMCNAWQGTGGVSGGEPARTV